MKRQKHVSVVVTREVNRVKQILLVSEKIDTIDSAWSQASVEVFSLPNEICLHQDAPDAAKVLVKDLVHEDFFDEMSFPLVPSQILPASVDWESYVVLGSVTDGAKSDEPCTESSNNNLYWMSVQEAYFRLSKQLVHDETFKDGKYIGLESLVALSVLKTMGLLG